MNNYLQWLAAETPTKWWHDSAVPGEIDAAIQNGALGVTTNPVLTYKAFQADPEFWRPGVEQIPQDIAPEERAEELLKLVASYAAERFLPIFHSTGGQHGYALGQLNPSICGDSEAMLEQALRFAAWGENIAVKLPTVRASLPVIEELAARGIAVCTTLNFSVFQALAAGMAFERGAKKARESGKPVRPCLIVQQGGRLDDYLLEVAADNGYRLCPGEIRQAGNAVCKKSYRLFKERGITAKIMPAGLRGSHHLLEMTGADMVFSLQARVQDLLLEENPERVYHIDEELPREVLRHLYTLPEFVRAYEEGALPEEEFIRFGVTQRTLSQFLWTGWAPLETYGSRTASSRWF